MLVPPDGSFGLFAQSADNILTTITIWGRARLMGRRVEEDAVHDEPGGECRSYIDLNREGEGSMRATKAGPPAHTVHAAGVVHGVNMSVLEMMDYVSAVLR